MNSYRVVFFALFGFLFFLVGCTPSAHQPNTEPVPGSKEISSLGIVRHILFASDPQYPWSKDPVKKNGRAEGDSQAPSTVKALSRSQVDDTQKLILDQYNSIQTWRASAMGGTANNPVIINGDMTAFGQGEDRAFLYGALDSILSSNWYFGLGNHDYQNNVGDCWNNGCARDSLNDLIGRMGELHMDSVLDYGSGLPTSRTYTGSFGYYKDFGMIRYIQLNLDPSYTRTIHSKGIPFYSSDHTFNVQSSVSNGWLERTLAQARSEYKFIIIGMHDPEQWSRSTDPAVVKVLGEFRRMLKSYNVSAIFAGHFHKVHGKYGDFYGDVPVFLSGSATDETYLIVDIDESEKYFQVWAVKNNNPAKAENIGAYPLKSQITNVTVPDRDETDGIGFWGTWGPRVFCPEGQYIRGYAVKGEDWQGNDGDDTALNGVRMYCSGSSNFISSKEGQWGSWRTSAMCPEGKAVIGFEMKLEGYQGGGDDTSADSMNLICEGGTTIVSPNNTNYGTWRGPYLCRGQAVAIGFETRVEDYQGNDDDTAFNGMRLTCGPKP